MQTIIDRFHIFFGGDSLFNLVAFVLAIIGIVLAIFFYIRSKRQRVPIYSVRSINLVEQSIEKIDNIEILYSGSTVKNLSIARVAIWNQGKETINNTDIAPSDPIKIICTGTTSFLGLKIVYEKNPVNNFFLFPVPNPTKPDEDLQNEMTVNFDYLDYEEGAIIQVFHTGKTGDEIQVVGSIKGAGKINRLGDPFFIKLRPISSLFDKLSRRNKKIVLGALLFVTPLLGFVSLVSVPSKEMTHLVWSLVGTALVTILYWSMAFSLLRRRIPKGFELFEEELKP